jgi:hypothetical protein
VTGRAVAPVPVRVAVQSRLDRQDVQTALDDRDFRILRTPDDPEFEERFFTRAAVPESADALAQARALLGEELRAALSRFPEPLVMTYDAGETRLFWEGEERDETRLELGADIVLAACRFRRATAYR